MKQRMKLVMNEVEVQIKELHTQVLGRNACGL